MKNNIINSVNDEINSIHDDNYKQKQLTIEEQIAYEERKKKENDLLAKCTKLDTTLQKFINENKKDAQKIKENNLKTRRLNFWFKLFLNIKPINAQTPESPLYKSTNDYDNHIYVSPIIPSICYSERPFNYKRHTTKGDICAQITLSPEGIEEINKLESTIMNNELNLNQKEKFIDEILDETEQVNTVIIVWLKKKLSRNKKKKKTR